MSNNATVTIPYNEYQDLLEVSRVKELLKNVIRKSNIVRCCKPFGTDIERIVIVDVKEVEAVLNGLVELNVVVRQTSEEK